MGPEKLAQFKMGIMDKDDIEFFLDGNGFFDPERHATRRACAEVLGRLPDELRDDMSSDPSILFFAPAKCLGETWPFHITTRLQQSQVKVGKYTVTSPLTDVNFSLVYLSPELEKQEYVVRTQR